MHSPVMLYVMTEKACLSQQRVGKTENFPGAKGESQNWNAAKDMRTLSN